MYSVWCVVCTVYAVWGLDVRVLCKGTYDSFRTLMVCTFCVVGMIAVIAVIAII